MSELSTDVKLYLNASFTGHAFKKPKLVKIKNTLMSFRLTIKLTDTML